MQPCQRDNLASLGPCPVSLGPPSGRRLPVAVLGRPSTRRRSGRCSRTRRSCHRCARAPGGRGGKVSTSQAPPVTGRMGGGRESAACIGSAWVHSHIGGLGSGDKAQEKKSP